MFVPFETLSPTSRIWVYQSNRSLSPGEVEYAETRLRDFTDRWAVHGSLLPCSFAVKYNQFVVLAADEEQQNTSGCSIDSSVRELKDLEQSLGIDLFDRNRIAFLLDGKVELLPLSELKEKFSGGMLDEATLTFNNLVTTKADLESNWLVPAHKTWLKRYIANALAKEK